MWAWKGWLFREGGVGGRKMSFREPFMMRSGERETGKYLGREGKVWDARKVLPAKNVALLLFVLSQVPQILLCGLPSPRGTFRSTPRASMSFFL